MSALRLYKTALQRARGAILLDGLIAILLFSIGILGVVALQAVAVKFTTNAKYRTDAAMFADQIIAQMWGSAKNPGVLSSFATGGPAYNTWETQVAASLPGASANPPTITFSGTQVTVVVNWSVPSENTVHNYTSVSQIVP